MLVPLAVTLDPLRAHMAAGVLQEHGIPAYVWGDIASSCYGPVMTGGSRLAVNEEDAGVAAEILNTRAPLPEESGEAPPPRVELSAAQALGTGLIQGALHVPLLMLLWFFLQLVLYALERIFSPRAMAPAELFPESPGQVIQAGLNGATGGALLGLLCGWTAWLLSDYKHGGRWGAAFVMFVTVLVLLPDVAIVIASFLRRLLETLGFVPSGM